MAAKEDLLKSIETLVTEGTFTLEALEGIKDLKNKAEKLASELDKTKKDLASSEESNSRLSDVVSTLQKRNNELSARESAVEAREAQVTILEKVAAVAQAESAVWEKATRIVFAPNTTRETIVRNLAHSNSRYDPSTGRSDSSTANESGSVDERKAEGYSETNRPEGT